MTYVPVQVWGKVESNDPHAGRLDFLAQILVDAAAIGSRAEHLCLDGVPEHTSRRGKRLHPTPNELKAQFTQGTLWAVRPCVTNDVASSLDPLCDGTQREKRPV